MKSTRVLHPGDVFDEFEVLQKIGTGAFSEVFLAHDTVLERVVVLKQLSPELSKDDREWAAFINEAQVTASFFHPGIITVHSLRMNGHSAVQVLEYMDGGTLRDLLDENGALDLHSMWNLAFQVGNALSYLHAQNIIHRDIKPENILYSKATHWFKLSDFGLAYHPNHPEFEALNDGQPGTLRYMSPEQAQDQPLDQRSDQYAFAAVLYEALTGQYYLPFEDPDMSDAEIIDHVVKGFPAPLSHIHSDVFLIEKLEDVLLRALAKKPAQRFKYVTRFMREFTRIIEYMESAPDQTQY